MWIIFQSKEEFEIKKRNNITYCRALIMPENTLVYILAQRKHSINVGQCDYTCFVLHDGKFMLLYGYHTDRQVTLVLITSGT